jgi:hypothetical protein
MKKSTSRTRKTKKDAAAKAPTLVQQKNDFTAEGSPPPGQVSGASPAVWPAQITGKVEPENKANEQ